MLKIKCFGCDGEYAIEEIMSDVVQTTTISAVENDSVGYIPESAVCDGGEVARYQCINCGYILRNLNDQVISDPQELQEYIKYVMEVDDEL